MDRMLPLMIPDGGSDIGGADGGVGRRNPWRWPRRRKTTKMKEMGKKNEAMGKKIEAFFVLGFRILVFFSSVRWTPHLCGPNKRVRHKEGARPRGEFLDGHGLFPHFKNRSIYQFAIIFLSKMSFFHLCVPIFFPDPDWLARIQTGQRSAIISSVRSV